MVPIATARHMALSLPETAEYLHFHLPAFKVSKKIFATIHEDKDLMMVKLSLIDQSVFCAIDKKIIFPVPGGWGLKGATFVNLEKVEKDLLMDALSCAWKQVADHKLVTKYFGDKE